MKKNKCLAFLLAIVFVFTTLMSGMTITTSAADDAAMAVPSIKSVDNGDGTYTVTLYAKGDLKAFDYGLVYDPGKVNYVSSSWDTDFVNAMDSGDGGIKAKKNLGNYVVVGGTSSNPKLEYNGVVATVKFEKKADVKDPGQIAVVTNSAAFDKQYHIDLNLITAFSVGHALPIDLNSEAEPILAFEKTSDGSIKVNISVNGDVKNFNYGLAYDSSVLTVNSYGFSKDFNDKFTTNTTGECTISKKDTYVEFNGNCSSDLKYNGVIASVTFKAASDLDRTKFVAVTSTDKYQSIFNLPLNLESAIKYGYSDSLTYKGKTAGSITSSALVMPGTQGGGIAVTELGKIAFKKDDFSTISSSSITISNLNISDSPIVESILKDIKNIESIKLTSEDKLEVFSFAADKPLVLQKKVSISINIPSLLRENIDKLQIAFIPTVSNKMAIQEANDYNFITPDISDNGTTATFETDQLGTFVLFENANIQSYILGDIDGDKEVSLGDANSALKMALKIVLPQSDTERKAADVNRDNEITLDDANKILKAALKIAVLQ